MNDKHSQGYIALITTLVVGSLAMLVTVGMLSIGITQTQTALVSYDGYRAQQLAEACAEYALQEIRNSTSFSGSGGETLGAGSCTYDVNSGGGENRTIEALGTVKDNTHRIEISIDQINPSINVTSWQLVDTF